MSLKKRMSYSEGTPKVHIEAEGNFNVYRLAVHMTLGQVEFAALGYKMLASLRRQLSKEEFEHLEHQLGGYRVRENSSNCPDPGMHLEAADTETAPTTAKAGH